MLQEGAKRQTSQRLAVRLEFIQHHVPLDLERSQERGVYSHDNHVPVEHDKRLLKGIDDTLSLNVAAA
jgi:hypothetical protein